MDKQIDIDDIISNDDYPDPSLVDCNINDLQPVFTEAAWDKVKLMSKLALLYVSHYNACQMIKSIIQTAFVEKLASVIAK